ncbi:MAG: NAD-dependent epimerase/dehydratase family protein [Deltaproteobacteria bacterium]|nr:NAD-dependent epimerase/dehydratase family protein [Deltaproteobacteria bacterium]
MKVLVTGATGFIGNYVVKELLKQPCQIIASSRNPDKASLCEWFPRVQYIPYDLNDTRENLFDFFQQPDLLIHLAWEGLPNYNDLFHLEKNLFSNYRFLKNMLGHGLKHLVVAGTCFEYGMQCGALSEDMETKPDNPYGLAKDTLRKFIEVLAQKYSFDLKWIRLFYLYGEGQSKNSILEQLKSAIVKGETVFPMSGGEQQRDYLPVERAAEYIVKISTQTKQQGIFNCCNGEPVSIRSLVDLGRYPYPDYEPMAFWGDNKKLKKILRSRNESTD